MFPVLHSGYVRTVETQDLNTNMNLMVDLGSDSADDLDQKLL